MTFIYQKTRQFFAQISTGMEEIATQELKEQGATRIRPAFRGIHFTATPACLYRVNYLARTITRVLAPLRGFRCPDPDTLYRETRAVSWPDLFRLDHTFAVFANVSHSGITHSRYAALRVKDAIADQFRDRFDRRPDVNPDSPDLWINLHIHKDRATISLDTSGGSLHRRGYRKTGLEAPMQETLAAAVIRLSGWDGEQPLCDPMCGAGTLLCEALMHYCRTPAGFLRNKFGFEFLPDFDPTIWRSVKQKADKKIRPLPPGLITGSDMAEEAVGAVRKNVEKLPHGDDIRISRRRFEDIPALENTVIVSNPPYGHRMGGKEETGDLMKDLGDFLKQRCKGSTAFLYFGDREMIKRIGLKPAWKKPLRNGPLDGRLVKYELY